MPVNGPTSQINVRRGEGSGAERETLSPITLSLSAIMASKVSSLF